jgi:diguanylate cyclase (GGDEF)-like protein
MGLKHGLGLDTLRGLLRFYTLLCVSLPLVLASGFFYFFQRGQVLDATLENMAASLVAERTVVRSWIDERFADVQFLALLDKTRSGDTDMMVQSFGKHVRTHPSVSAVVYVDPQGMTRVDSSGSPSVYVGDRAYFEEARQGRNTLVTGIIGRASGKPICLFATPVARPDGSFGGVVFISVQLQNLDVWLRETATSMENKAVVCDSEGTILAPSAAVAVSQGRPSARVSPQALAAGERGLIYRDGEGREMLAVSVSLDRGGLTLVRQEPSAAALAGYRRQALWVALGTLAAIILISPLVLRLCRNLEKPLETLCRHARELRGRAYDETCPLAAPPGLPREVGELFVAFSEMACDVRSHIAAIERLSVQDELTGLYNRRFLFTSGLKLVAAALRAGQPCCCLMLDVDHFKRVNDTFGHQAGDHVLAHVGKLLAGAIRRSDLAARYGGEEFAVLLVGAGLEQGQELAEGIRRAMAEHPCAAAGRNLSVTVSVGVAVTGQHKDFGEAELDDLLARADAALYAAKDAGRNRVVAEMAE